MSLKLDSESFHLLIFFGEGVPRGCPKIGIFELGLD
jgi:hypothetical protein